MFGDGEGPILGPHKPGSEDQPAEGDVLYRNAKCSRALDAVQYRVGNMSERPAGQFGSLAPAVG